MTRARLSIEELKTITNFLIHIGFGAETSKWTDLVCIEEEGTNLLLSLDLGKAPITLKGALDFHCWDISFQCIPEQKIGKLLEAYRRICQEP